jgi:hypothetical protein
MSEEILNKIKYLCKNINKDEWSGALFYSIEGSIKDPLTFKIKLEDILPLDKGTSAYTEYELDDRYLDYLMEDEKRMDWYVGHIHSHNTMAVFFSGTDMAELNDNSPSHNFYLSLIVNNYMDFMAKVAFVASLEQEIKEIPYLANDEDGTKYIIDRPNITLKKDKMFVYNCEIISPFEQVIVEEGFDNRVKEIMKPKPIKQFTPHTYPAANTPVNTAFSNGKWINGKFVPNTPTAIPAVNNLENAKLANKIKHYKIDESKLSKRGKKIKDIASMIDFRTFDDLSEIDELSPIDTFLVELMKFTTPIEPDENLEDALVLLEDLEVDAYQIASSVIENYTFLYDKHFPDSTDEEFIEDTYTVIDLLEDEVMQFPFINVTIEAIKAMIVEFEKNDTTV